MASAAVIKGGSGGGGGKGKAVIKEDGKKKMVVKQKSATVVTKSEVKGKSVASSSKTITKTATVKGRAEKKVYTLPGQKHDPPEEREPLRIFYESLSKQIPTSEMAEVWMMEHGLLSPERAKKAYERKQKRQQQLRMGTPIKLPKVSKNGDVKARKEVTFSNEDDDDFIVKRKRSKV